MVCWNMGEEPKNSYNYRCHWQHIFILAWNKIYYIMTTHDKGEIIRQDEIIQSGKRKRTKSGRDSAAPKTAWRFGWASISHMRTWFNNNQKEIWKIMLLFNNIKRKWEWIKQPFIKVAWDHTTVNNIQGNLISNW